MKNKGPVIAILFIAIIAIVVFAAFLATKYFGDGDSATGGVAEINYTGLWDNPDIYEPLIKEYEEANANVKINYTRASFTNLASLTYKGAHQADVEERLQTGNVDIVRVHNTWLPKLRKYIAPAPSDIITGAEAAKIYYPAIVSAIVSSDGQVAASPQTIDGLVLFYNKELFAEAGIIDPVSATRDWDVTLATAKKLTKIDANGTTLKISGINMGSVSNIQSSPEILLTMLTQADIDILTYNQQTNSYQASFATDEGAAALSRYFEFSQEKVWSTRTTSDLELFATGRLAMYIAPSWRAIDLVAMNSNLRFETLTLPVLPGANPDVPQYIASYWIDIVSNQSKNSAEAWKFLNWLSQPEQLRKINTAQRDARLIGNPYPRMDMAEEQKGAPYIGPIIEMAPNMKSWPLFDYGIWEEVFRRELLEYEDQGGVAKDNLIKVENEINKLTLKELK